MMRVIGLIKKAHTLNLLIDTLIFILPSLTNIALMVVLGYSIFTALGINLFGKVRWTGEINANANFQQFPISMMLLMRCSSGELSDVGLLRDWAQRARAADSVK